MSKFKKFSIAVLILIGILVLIYGVVFFKSNLTGQVSLELDSNYQEGQTLEGKLKIALKEGELIPSSTKIVFEDSEKSYEYKLKYLVSDNLSNGGFYVEGKEISGTGEGYGIEGVKTTSETVYFTLDISSESSSSETSSTNEETNEEEQEETTTEENETQEEAQEEQEEANSEKEQEALEKEEEISTEEDETQEETDSEEEPVETSPITGNVVKNVYGSFFNLFLRLTGQVSLEIDNQIQGEVTSENEFVYNLKQGQTAEIITGSVKTDSEKLSDSDISLSIEESKVIVKTNYGEDEEGFGEEYIGKNTKVLEIDLSDLNITPKGDELKISLDYEGDDILSLSTPLTEGDISTESETQEEIIDETKTLAPMTTDLTEEERNILIETLENSSVKITKAEKTSQGILVRFEVKGYWIDHYYDSDISEDELTAQVEEERSKFLKDLARKFLEENPETEQVEGLIGVYDI